MDNYKKERGEQKFWRNLGFDIDAAYVAAECFPEGWIGRLEWWHRNKYRGHIEDWYGHLLELAIPYAEENARKASLTYRTDMKHPAFWLEQGYDFDEAARAIAAIALVQLQLEATPPPPSPQDDNFIEVAQALLMQGAIQRRLEGPGSGNAQYNDGPESKEPFDPDDYPRFQSEGR